MTTEIPDIASERTIAVPEAPFENTRSVLSPHDALAKIRAGETLRDVTVTRLVLKGEFAAPVKLERVTLVRPTFDGATFAHTVQMSGCTLVNLRCGHRTVFEQDFLLHGATLSGVQLVDVTVRGEFRCDNIRAAKTLDLSRCRFEKVVRFWDASFEGWVNVKKCEFLGTADFRSFHADQGMTITGCRFAADVLFRGAAVSKKLDFGDSAFEALLDLSKAKLPDFAYLQAIVQGPAQRFAFSNMVAERVMILPAQVAGRLASEEKRDYAAAMMEYALLKRVYATLHQYEEEDWAFCRFKVNQRRAKRRSWLRPWTKAMQFADLVFLDYGCGYGTNPFRAVTCGAALILMFAGVYAAGIHQFEIDQAPFPNLPPDGPVNRLVFGLVTSISIFTSGFGGDALGLAHGWMLAPLSLEALLGTLLWGLFIVAFSRKVIR
jgi:hypothetical protein